MANHPSKIYTDVLEYATKALERHREILKESGTELSETKLRKRFFGRFSNISMSTYNKYLKELKDGTYIRCERD